MSAKLALDRDRVRPNVSLGAHDFSERIGDCAGNRAR
jgi:hypothetical protein